jgi:hypothetical protein
LQPAITALEVLHQSSERLPDGTEVAYQAPELYVFHPGARQDVEQATLLSVCLVRAGERRSTWTRPLRPTFSTTGKSRAAA